MGIVARIIALLLCVMTVSGSQPPVQKVYELSEHYIDKLNMTISLPEEAYVTGRTVSADYEPLEMFGMTASQLEVELKKGNIYCTALWFPEECDMAEIIVTMTEDDDSRTIFQLKDHDDFYLSSLAESYSNYSQHGLDISAMYTDASVVRNEQAAYIKAHGVKVSSQGAENHLHYMTIVNGQRLEITLVEHFSVNEGEERPVTVSAAGEQLMDEVVESVTFDGIDSGFVAKNKNFLFGTALVSVLSVAMIIAYFISKYRVSRALAASAKQAEMSRHSLPETDVQDAPDDHLPEDPDTEPEPEKQEDSEPEKQEKPESGEQE